jgi:hypothetical protein
MLPLRAIPLSLGSCMKICDLKGIPTAGLLHLCVVQRRRPPERLFQALPPMLALHFSGIPFRISILTFRFSLHSL